MRARPSASGLRVSKRDMLQLPLGFGSTEILKLQTLAKRLKHLLSTWENWQQSQIYSNSQRFGSSRRGYNHRLQVSGPLSPVYGVRIYPYHNCDKAIYAPHT